MTAADAPSQRRCVTEGRKCPHVTAECGYCTANPTGFFVQRQLPVQLALNAQ